MKVPETSSLLSEFDGLNHHQRVQRIAKLAHACAGSAEFNRLVGDLIAKKTHYEGSLALTAAIHARDEARLLELLNHNSVEVTRLAAKAVGSIATNEAAIRNAVLTGSVVIRRGILNGIAHAKRSQLADALFADVSTQLGSVEMLELVKVISPAVLQRILPEIAHAISCWRGLAQSAPDVVLQVIEMDVMSRPVWERHSRFYAYGSSFEVLASTHYVQLLRLIAACKQEEFPSALRAALPILMRRDANGVFDLLMSFAPQHRIPLALLSGQLIRLFTREQILQLAPYAHLKSQQFVQFLGQLPPSQRGEVFLAAREGIDTAVLGWNASLINVLSRGPVRTAELDRVSKLKTVTDSREKTLQVIASKPFAHAVRDLKKATQSSDANDRILAWDLLIFCAATNRDSDALHEVLTYAYRFRNEQDPVLQV